MAQLREEKISVYEFPSDEVIFQLFSFHATLKSEYISYHLEHKWFFLIMKSIIEKLIWFFFPGKNWRVVDEKPCSICSGRLKHDNWGVINSKSEWWQWLSWTSRNENFRMHMEEKREEGVILGAQSTLRSDNIAISRHALSHPSDSIWARLLQENILQALALFNLSYV